MTFMALAVVYLLVCAGLGLARGMFYKRDGTLVASVAQEGSIRERRNKPEN